MAADTTYLQLQKDVTALGQQVTRAADAIARHTNTIREAAADTARVAEGIGAMGVDSATVAETNALARLMDGLSDSAAAYKSRADTTARSARAAHDQNRASHGGIAAAVQRATVNTKGLNREWLRQE